jgi:hypothetical protein
MTSRIEIMLQSRHLEERPPEDGEVEGMWSKALGSWESSALAGLNPDARFTLAYQAALQASTAVIRAAGYQVRGEGHHYQTFAAVVALSSGELSKTARDLNGIRQMRHGAIYDWQSHLDEHDAEEIRDAAWRLFTHAETWLRARHPAIAPLPTRPT